MIPLIVGESGQFVILIYTACKSLAKWWVLFLGTSHIDLEGWQNKRITQKFSLKNHAEVLAPPLTAIFNNRPVNLADFRA